MRSPSLARRLFLLAALWSALSLALAGVVLVAVFRASAERAFDERLEVNLKTLIGAVGSEIEQTGFIKAPDNLGEPRFELPLSGWYWMVRSEPDGKVVAASNSLTGEVLASPFDLGVVPDANGVARSSVIGPDTQTLRALERRIAIDDDKNYRVVVAGDTGGLSRDLFTFSVQTIAILALVGIGLVLTTFIQVRIGLKPLERMRQALFRIRTGEAERLEGEFPSEIAPLAQELNALIEANREVVERARTQVGNLAHALKTPLSVITNEARGSQVPFAGLVSEQAALMRDQIQNYLERARIAAQRRVIGVVTEVGPVLERLVRAMRRIHADRDLEIQLINHEGLRFRGEQQDLEEMAGNLIDNACKWARSRVRVEISARPGTGLERNFMSVLVDDDGPGISPEKRAEIGKRGKRLDETVPGTGLGLSIVTELAALYGGRLDLGDSPLGGFRCELTLPVL
ncbi:MAG: histidine kinase [Hyphomicrobiaceae bacterium]|nr:histidine kinase [Hyphomicrobiaceae bacterium]